MQLRQSMQLRRGPALARARYPVRAQISANRWRTARTYWAAQRARTSLAGRRFYPRQAGRGYAYQLARGGARFAAARRDSVIRNYVGPRSAYTQVTSPATGGTQVGSASYYGGRSRTANGGFVGSATCAHRSLPFGTRVLVTNLANSRQAVLTVNDRGPFIRGRIVDVSVGAAGTLGMLHSGTAPVRVQVVGGGSG